MSSIHVIRLRGPWYYEPLARTVWSAEGTSHADSGSLPPAGRTQIPADWGETLGADFRGRVRYTRHFHRPTNLEPGDRVELVLQRLDAFGDVQLNGFHLAHVAPASTGTRVEITRHLQPRNELVVLVELPRLTDQSAPLPRPEREGQSGGLIGEVRLEIHSA